MVRKHFKDLSADRLLHLYTSLNIWPQQVNTSLLCALFSDTCVIIINGDCYITLARCP